ncbi:CopK family periplasmic copper-binding protein, partial [Listeria monocytogenes]|nr:CopK family periplasmic copper-binding protein [Listeria monocytogenes]
HAAAQAAKEMVPLADGGTLYIFKDGKMAQERRFGRAVYLNVGASVATKDGRNIAITSNEVARLGSLLQKEHGG